MSSVAVVGASGRLGTLVCEVIDQLPMFRLTAKLSSVSQPSEADDADIVFDVSHPEVSAGVIERALAHGQKVIVGTSGWNAQKISELQHTVERYEHATVLIVPNFSIGSVIETKLAQLAAPYFSSIEIVEAHHDKKIDSPSGTAVRTAEIIAEVRGSDGVDAPFADQEARGQLVAGVPVHSIRMQGVIAKQEVRFGGQGEVLTITHDTHSRDAYRAGIQAALERVTSLAGLTVGLEHVLGL